MERNKAVYLIAYKCLYVYTEKHINRQRKQTNKQTNKTQTQNKTNTETGKRQTDRQTADRQTDLDRQTDSYKTYGFDQKRLIWYVFRLWDMICYVSSVSPSSEQTYTVHTGRQRNKLKSQNTKSIDKQTH